ncbi:MAG: DUF2017 family protein [Nitriliruptoraceae bacterium]
MNRTFRRVGNHVRMRLESAEVDLLRALHEGLVATLKQPDSDDPVIERLFPAAVHGDDADNAEVRRLLRDELLTARRQGLDAVVEILDRMQPHRGGFQTDLVDEEPALLLGVFNDLRLAIGARIDIAALDRDTVTDEPTLYRLAVADHLGWLQEQLIELIDPSAVEFRQHLNEGDET